MLNEELLTEKNVCTPAIKITLASRTFFSFYQYNFPAELLLGEFNFLGIFQLPRYNKSWNILRQYEDCDQPLEQEQ